MRHLEGARLARVAFPLGGLGAGMLCLQGTGGLGSLSLRHTPEVWNEPNAFSALWVETPDGPLTRVLEGPVPRHKVFGTAGTLSGGGLSHFGRSYGLPRFARCSFEGRFPFADISLADDAMPLTVMLTGFSPFTPLQPDDSSLPAATLRYTFHNPTDRPVRAVYSFNTYNFMAFSTKCDPLQPVDAESASVLPLPQGFVLRQGQLDGHPQAQGDFCACLPQPGVRVNTAWFQGGHFDTLSMLWGELAAGGPAAGSQPENRSPGATLSLPFTLAPGGEKAVDLYFTWHVPASNLRLGPEADGAGEAARQTHRPWYAGRFAGAGAVMDYYRAEHDRLWDTGAAFSEALFSSTIPPEALEAVAANLSILKSPTVLRQPDGRMWAWEGCFDTEGSCYGSCTHVWNYAQAVCHLFPSLERSLRATEFGESQNAEGHQEFRSSLPIRPALHTFHAAADGQLGGIMKMHREWRIGGDTAFVRDNWPRITQSLDYCIRTWDPSGQGVLREPHHNTYDIEFWGADGMCTSFYLGALKAACKMGEALGEDVGRWQKLYGAGRAYMEAELFNGEYFCQRVEWETLRAELATGGESPESAALTEGGGPKYQYGEGCLSDGVLGAWMAQVCCVGEILDPAMVKSHLLAVHRHNLQANLSRHANPQRPGYALGDESGLLLCSWPRGGRPALPFVYSDEVWTGIEHQVAAHLASFGCAAEALEIVRASRRRYDGTHRNPFNEYECGHWYARALASYAYLRGFGGVWYDAVDQTLHLGPQTPADATLFLCAQSGYGTVRVRAGKATVNCVYGGIPVKQVVRDD